MAAPAGDSTISGLPSAGPLLGPEVFAIDQLVSGTLTTVKLKISDLAVQLFSPTMPVGVTQGGTGRNTMTAHAVMLGEGTSAVGLVSPGAAGLIFQSNGATLDPSFLAALTQASTGQFFAQNGATINRMNDRVFIGGATVSDGAFPPVTNDWFQTYENSVGYTNSTLSGTVAIETNPGAGAASSVALTVAAQSLTSLAAGASCIPVEAFAINNSPSFATSAWAFYGEAHRVTAASGSVYGMELDTHTLFASSTPTPYSQGNVVGIQLASGAGIQGNVMTASITGTVLTVTVSTPLLTQQCAIGVGSAIYGVGVTAGTVVTSLGTGTGGIGTYNINNSQSVSSEYMVASAFQQDASVAIQIVNNPMKWQAGIMFDATSLTGCDGVNGTAVAIGLATGHAFQWYGSSGAKTASIIGTGTTTANSHKLQFGETTSGFVQNQNGNFIFSWNSVASAVNNLLIQPAITGSAPGINAVGSDTNIGLALAAKGTGSISLTNPTTVTGSLVASGNDKLLYNTTNALSIPNSTATTVTTFTKVFDLVNANFAPSTGTFTAPATGHYHVDVQYEFANAAGAINSTYELLVLVAGAAVFTGKTLSETANSGNRCVKASGVVSMTSGQLLTTQLFQNSGGAVAMSGVALKNYISIHRVP